MIDFFSGHVLRPARSASANAPSTSSPVTGVTSQVRFEGNAVPAGSATVIEPHRDLYRSAVLSGSDEEEYLVWAANAANIAVLEDPSWAISTTETRILPGDYTVGAFTDGSERFVLVDPGGRDIAGVTSMTYVEGDDLSETPITTTDIGLTSVSGVIEITNPANHLSLTRGDRILSVSYYLASARFWWTRNDRYLTRFDWNGASGRWEPLKGGPVKSLGSVETSTVYNLSPKPQFSAGTFLPGSVDPDAYSMLRVGALPNTTSIPVASGIVVDIDGVLTPFNGVQVVADADFDPGYDFSTSSPQSAAIVSATSGKLAFNPLFIQGTAGQEVWYGQREFEPESSGTVATLLEAASTDLFIAPIPGPTERPILTIGNRAPLAVALADTDAELSGIAVSEGEVGISLSTGKLKFSFLDTRKADPGTRATPNPDFELPYFGAKVFYKGVTGNIRPQPLRAPTALVDGAGSPVVNPTTSTELFVSDATFTPDPLGGSLLGVSGVLAVPDGTGSTPDSRFLPSVRPNESGLVRQVKDFGDTIIFGIGGAVEVVRTVDYEDDLPSRSRKVPNGEAVISREAQAGRSRVMINSRDLGEKFEAGLVYFQQAMLAPAVYADKVRLVSRIRDSFVLDGTEMLHFKVNGTQFAWTSAPLVSVVGVSETFDADTVVASIDATLTIGSATNIAGHLVLSADTPAGNVEILYGPSGVFGELVLDTSGADALGLLPGWHTNKLISVATGSPLDMNWLPDNGSSLGLFRTNENLDRTEETSDFATSGRIEDLALTDSVGQSPLHFLDKVPLEDIVGYDEGVFFKTVEGLFENELDNFVEVLHQFENSKFAWLGQTINSALVTQPSVALPLGAQQVVPESLSHVVDGFLRVAPDGGVYEFLEPGEDFLTDAQSGTVQLVDRVNTLDFRSSRGSIGTATLSEFTDDTEDFVARGVTPGYRLKVIMGDAVGSYLVTDVPTSTTLTVSPEFPLTVDDLLVGYEVYSGVEFPDYDRGIIADVVFSEWNHLPEETFKVRLISALDVAGSGDLTVNATRALENSRDIKIRFGSPGASHESNLTVLRRTAIGIIANDALFLPEYVDPLLDNFEIRVGNDLFTPAKVGSFSANPSGVEVRTTDSALKFGTSVLDDYEASNVSYVERFRAGADISSGTAQLDPDLSQIRISGVDATTFDGSMVYFVEEMITEGRKDVSLSPKTGSANFATPLLSGQIVEVDYTVADVSGEKALDDDGNEQDKTEFLPLYVRGEVATRVSGSQYSFNPSGRTIYQDFDPVIYIGVSQPNYGTQKTASVDFLAGTINFGSEVPTTETVTISYAVLEAFGGETGYNTSTLPVYRPPFHIGSNTDTFSLSTDRTGDFTEGLVIRLGASLLYIMDSNYNAVTDSTEVTFWPPTDRVELGSVSPGNDVLQLITSEPVARKTLVIVPPGAPDPGNLPPQPLGGFLIGVSTLFPAVTSYEPVAKGDTEVIVNGNIFRFAVAGHMIDIGGYPFLIIDSEQDSGGRKTRIKLGAAAPKEFTSESLSISVRPIYPPGSRVLLGTGQVVTNQPFELVRFGEIGDSGQELPGRTLVLDRDYRLDQSGLIELLTPFEDPALPGQRLTLSYTTVDILSPKVVDEAIVMPRYATRFSSITTPSDDNGLLGLRLNATYSFEAPDSFYFRTVPVESYITEVVDEITAGQQASNPGFGSSVATFTASANSDQGNVGLRSQLTGLIQKDAMSRRLLSFFNATVTAFEQILETSDGGIVGDRDGKFKLFVGKGRKWPTPGYEDDITLELLSRNLWAQIFFSETGLRFIEDDYVVDPTTATLVGEVLEGRYIDPDTFRAFIELQRSLIKNDVDDTVIIGRDRPRRKRLGPKPLGVIQLSARGRFAQMADPHLLSRVFPEHAVAFTTLSPGVDATDTDPGVYTFGRFLSFGGRKRTTGSVIGEVGNPVLGIISQIRSVRAQERRARARVWAYSPTGFPELDSIPEYATDFGSNPRPALIATPLEIEDLPIDSSTGFPDPTRLYSDIGDLPDLNTGDPELSTPGFVVGDEIAFGRPTGEFIEPGYKYKTFNVSIAGFDSQLRISSVYVDEIFGGCVMTFKYGQDKNVTQADLFVEKTSDTEGTPLNLQRGDTLLVVPPTGLDEAPNDPPTLEDLANLAKGSPSFRSGFDVRFRGNGEIVDATLPSFKDPTFFGLKEITGQNPPLPLSTIEAGVEFDNSLLSPLEVPALRGESTNDDGDYTLPYLSGPGSEKTLLRETQNSVSRIVRSELGAQAQYPDEVYGNDGEVLASAVGANPPATFLTGRNLLPTHVVGDGTGPVRQGDLWLLETGQPFATQGILSVGEVSAGQIEPPRFVTQSTPGDPIGFTLTGAMAWIDLTHATGVSVTETVAATTTTEFDFSTTTIVLDDGLGGGTIAPFIGGYNDFFDAADPGTELVLHVIKSATDPGAGAPGSIVSTITIRKITEGGVGITSDTFEVDGGGGPVPVVAGTLWFETNLLRFETLVPVFDFTNITAGLPHDFRADVSTASGNGYFCYVDEDRLTFVTPFDVSSALPRGTVHPLLGSTSLECQLDVHTVESPLGALTVNASVETNGGSPYTFLVRDTAATTVGTFSAAQGRLKVMGFEGHGNVPLSGVDVEFSAVPSSDVNFGTGKMDEVGAHAEFSNRIIEIDPTITDLTEIQPGDVVYVDRADGASAATTKAGSYLVRYVVPSNDSTLLPTSYTRTISLPTSVAGSGTGFAPFSFPTVSTDYSGTAPDLDISDASGFAPSGRVFIIVAPDDITATGDDFARCVVSAAYASKSGNTLETLSDFQYADNAVTVGGDLPGVYFAAQAVTGATVSGFETFQVSTDNSQYPYAPGTFSGVTIQSLLTNVSEVVSPIATVTTETADFFGTYPAGPIPYSGAPSSIEISAITDPQWDALHDPNNLAGGSGSPRCLLPNDFLLAEDATGPGYLADAGIYLEPSTPRSGLDLAGGPFVVDTSNSLTATEIGVRDVSLYGPGAGVERVMFSVRRIRRFSPVLSTLNQALTPLRYLYETRRGVVTSYTPNLSATGGVVTASGTQLGGFDESLVNINPGDVFRLLDASGNLLEEHEIVEVVSGTELRLDAPGLTNSPTGLNFEVYLQQFPVPQEQSNDQLLDLMTDEVLFERTHNYTAMSGGKVDSLNELSDTDAGVDFTSLGVREGDILIVDPAGGLEGPSGPAAIPERGSRPFGDIGLAPFDPGDEGGPSPLDDNRGYYRIGLVSPVSLTVEAEGTFGGDSSSGDVILGTPAYPYVVYPTVSASALTGGTEGQMDLRPTAFADGSNSFLGAPESVAPFSYRVIRPSLIFQRESIELVLMLRERILSWIEEVQTFAIDKSGTYEVFQSDEHISDIEDPGEASTGLGVPSNDLLAGLEGEVDRFPFENTRDALSVLDRRYFILDEELDVDGYSDFANDEGRPVMPDFIDLVLNQTDQLRRLRYAWLDYRTNQVGGTLQAIRRFEDKLPEQLEEQLRAALVKKSVGSAE